MAASQGQRAAACGRALGSGMAICGSVIRFSSMLHLAGAGRKKNAG
jgi:hypothetical protein